MINIMMTALATSLTTTDPALHDGVSFKCQYEDRIVETASNSVELKLVMDEPAGMEDFREALADFQNGHVVDLDVSLQEPPPEP